MTIEFILLAVFLAGAGAFFLGSGDVDILGLLVMALTIAFALCAWALVGIGSRTCEETAHAMGRKGRWTLYTECMIQRPDGRWIPADTYRSTDSER